MREATMLKALLLVLRPPADSFDGVLLVALLNPSRGNESRFSSSSYSSCSCCVEAWSTASISSSLDNTLALLLSGLGVTF